MLEWNLINYTIFNQIQFYNNKPKIPALSPTLKAPILNH